MERYSSLLEKTLGSVSDSGEKNTIATNSTSKIARVVAGMGLIRFEEKKESYIWAHPDEIIFVKSADHYVKSLISRGRQKKWMIRHCTLKELFVALPPANFMRLNKFYLINRNHFLRINENEKMLYLADEYSIPVPHRISRYVLDILKK
jgi:DNA-binding LytR/AlgR family response regulator